MEKQSLICMWKTLFHTDNITSTLMIVVFSINWSWMFALYVRQMCCKLELKTLNNRKTTASLRNHQKRRVCSDPCICTTQQYSGFFQQSFAQNLKNIFPTIWYCCNIRRPYKICNILYKTNKKAVSFLSTTSRTSRDLSALAFIFPAAWHVFVWKHRKVCCSLLQWCDVGTVVWSRTCTMRFFRSLLSVQWSDVEHALCTFSGVCWDYFQVFRRFGCAKWKYCEKWHLPAPKIWNPFFYT